MFGRLKERKFGYQHSTPRIDPRWHSLSLGIIVPGLQKLIRMRLNLGDTLELLIFRLRFNGIKIVTPTIACEGCAILSPISISEKI